jgi:hypothetical protein
VHRPNQVGPVQAAIESFLVEKSKLIAARCRLASNGQLTHEQASEILSLVEEFERIANELSSWVGPPFHVLAAKDQERNLDKADAFLRRNFSALGIASIVEELKKKPRGRPPELRVAALEAWETKLQQPQQTWKNILSELCRVGRCGSDVQHVACFKNLMREVDRLKECLRSHKIVPRQNM